MKLHRDTLLRDDRGQAMIEACIALALMAFVWVLTFFAAYMTANASRTAIAARHAAWAAGNGVSVDAAGLAGDVFLEHAHLVDLDARSDATSDASGMLSGNAIMDAVLSIFPDIQKADVSYGVGDGETEDAWPFILTQTRFPFMPDAEVPTLMQVSTHAEWDTVSETWDGFFDLFKGIAEAIFP